MTTLRLKSWNVDYARQQMAELQEPKPNYACWVGSVSTDDKSLLSTFLSKAKQGDVQSLAQYQQIGGNLVYAVLLNIANDQWKLVVIDSPTDPNKKERPIFVEIIRLGIPIEAYDRQVTKAEQQLKQDCNLRFRDIF